MGHVYTFSASSREARAVESLMERGSYRGVSGLRTRGRIGSNDVTSIITGMGPSNARRSAEAALQDDNPANGSSAVPFPTTAELASMSPRMPSLALVIGLAGSLTESIQEGELVIYESCVTAEGHFEPCSKQLNNRIISSLSGAGIPSRLVAGISEPRIAGTRDEKLELAKTGAAAVDMESHEIVAVSRTVGVPIAVLRVISDNMDKAMPNFNAALNSDGEFAPVALALACVRRPLATAGLLVSSRRALKTLTRALNAILNTSLEPAGQDVIKVDSIMTSHVGHGHTQNQGDQADRA